MAALLLVREIAAYAFLFFKYLPINSVDICSLSEADPPLPQKITLFFYKRLQCHSENRVYQRA